MITLLAALALQTAAPAQDDDPIAMLLAQQEAEAARPVARPVVAGDLCAGDFRQGSLIICRAEPGATVELGDSAATADEAGYAVIGLRRRAGEELAFTVTSADGEIIADHFQAIEQREYDLQHVDGVPQSTVTPDPSTLPRRQREYAQKQTAFQSVWDGQGFLDGFIAPSEGITTGVYGSARVYNDGHEGSPHWGLDWANDTGTPVVAPASGLVTLAEADMYYEGGLVFIDHGQGLISAFLHMSAVHVEEGDIVQQGDLIGEIGAGGRATGPHLDWRVKLRNGFYIDPQSLLDLELSR